MGDRITETRETGFAQNLTQSIKGVAIGLCLFLVSIGVLWWNEGRIDLSKIVKKSVPINSESIDTSANGKFISLTGMLQSKEAVGDPWYLKAGPYISLNRKVEMYSWTEHASTTTEKKLGGKKVTETTYSYDKDWTKNPPDSSIFFEPEGHQNPPLPAEDKTFRTRTAIIGAYSFDAKSASLPSPSPIQIARKDFVPSINAGLERDYIYVGRESLSNPQVGDMRISYSAVMAGTMATLFGKLNGDSIGPYLYRAQRIFRAIAGSREEAIAQIATEHRITTWILRLVGFLIMWTGLCLFFGPLNVVFDFIPMLENLSRSLVNAFMFVVALALSFITILISLIAHNMILLIILIAGLLSVPWGIRRIRGESKATKPSAKKPDTLWLRNSHLEEEQNRRENASHQVAPDTDAGRETMNIICPQCETRYTLPKSLAGRKARCKNCEHKFYIPYESISEEDGQ